jgi:putative FmdB family regulatory protein
MPTFDYHCGSCDYTWDEVRKISDRKTPESEACPNCHSIGYVAQTISAPPSLGDPVRLGFTRPNSGMREALQRVQEKSPNATTKNNSTLTRM